MDTSTDTRLRKVAEAHFPTRFGQFRIFGFEAGDASQPEEIVALRMGDVSGPPAPLVRIHSQCLTGDVFHSNRCDCRAQLEMAREMIAAEGRGMVIYEMQEGRGIGLLNKLLGGKVGVLVLVPEGGAVSSVEIHEEPNGGGADETV